MSKAIFNVGHAAMMINAFNTNNFEELKVAALDQLHQPIRGNIKGGKRYCASSMTVFYVRICCRR
jgi:homoserine kinase